MRIEGKLATGIIIGLVAGAVFAGTALSAPRWLDGVHTGIRPDNVAGRSMMQSANDVPSYRDMDGWIDQYRQRDGSIDFDEMHEEIGRRSVTGACGDVAESERSAGQSGYGMMDHVL